MALNFRLYWHPMSRSSLKSSSEETSHFNSQSSYQPHLSDSIIERYHVKSWINQRDLNQNSACLMDKYIDIVAYEPPIKLIVSRIPTILNLSKKELSESAIEGLAGAKNSWAKIQKFYANTISDIECCISENCAFFEENRIDRFKAACLSLPKFSDKIDTAHEHLASTIRGLYSGGFTYASIHLHREAYRHRGAYHYRASA